MYTKFKLSGIQLGEVKVGNIEVEVKYKLDEAVGMYDLSRKVIKELPEVLEDVKNTAIRFMEIEKEVDDIMEERILADIEARNNNEPAMENRVAEIVKARLDEVLSVLRKSEEDIQN